MLKEKGTADIKLPCRDSTAVSWWAAFCRGSWHNPPRRRCPLCSQPFTTGGGETHQLSITHSTADTTNPHQPAWYDFSTMAAHTLLQKIWEAREQRSEQVTMSAALMKQQRLQCESATNASLRLLFKCWWNWKWNYLVTKSWIYRAKLV